MAVLAMRKFNVSASVVLCYVLGESMDLATLSREWRQVFVCAFGIELVPEYIFKDLPLEEIKPLGPLADELLRQLTATVIPQIIATRDPPPAQAGTFSAFASLYKTFHAAFMRYRAAFKKFYHQGVREGVRKMMTSMLLYSPATATEVQRQEFARWTRDVEKAYVAMHQERLLVDFEAQNADLVLAFVQRGFYTLALRTTTSAARMNIRPTPPVPDTPDIADDIDAAALMIV